MATHVMSSVMRTSLARSASRSAFSHTPGFRASNLSKPSSFTAAYANNPSLRPFHNTSRKQLLPALPQKIHGGVNDPAPVPDPHPLHGSYHWTFERLISIGLVPLTVAPFVSGTLNPMLDAILCATLIVHTHIGFQAIIIDYLPIKRVPNTRKLFMWGLRLGTVLVGVGFYQFETNDVGLTEAIKRVWTA